MEDYFEPNTSKSGDGYPLTTDEIEYKDPNIPTKRHSSYLPSHLFNRHVLQDWDG